jgi:RNA polymerase sigma-70 factor, ECF subfamily
MQSAELLSTHPERSQYLAAMPPEPVDFNLEQVYETLHAIARYRLADEQRGHTLQATALVNEAYIKLSADPAVFQLERSRFYLLAAAAMRRILIDHARTKNRVKRGGGNKREILDVAHLAFDDDPSLTLSLHDAIRRLEEVDADAARVVDLRFFAGLTIEETAEVLGVSDRSVKRDWQFARAWLYRALGE